MKPKKLVWCPRFEDVAANSVDITIGKRKDCHFYKKESKEQCRCVYNKKTGGRPCIGVEGTFTPKETP